METDTQSLLGRVRDLEKKLENGIVAVPAQGSGGASSGSVQGASQPPVPRRAELPKAVPEDVRAVAGRWNTIVADMAQPMKTYMKGARLSLGADGRLVIVVEDGMASDYLKNQENKEQLKRMISESAQKEMEIEVQSVESGREYDGAYIDLSDIIHMEIEIEEE